MSDISEWSSEYIAKEIREIMQTSADRGYYADEILRRITDLERERDNWMEFAAQMNRNADFYQGIVREIGEGFGVEARTSDDGSIQDDVLALKVPELVAELREAVRWRKWPEEKPEPGVKVVGKYTNDLGKERKVMCMWVSAKTLPVHHDATDFFGEYDEETDEFWSPEGWYETIEAEVGEGWSAIPTDKPIEQWLPIPEGSKNA